MAARKTRTVTQPWKDKIQTSMLVNRLQNHVEGKVKLDNSQVTAALGLIKKTIPDLSSVAIGQDDNLGPITVRWLGLGDK